MSSQAPELTVHTRIEAAAIVVAVTGEVDMVSAPILLTAISDALATDHSRIVVDLSEVGFFGSAGLSVLVRVAEAAVGRELRIVVSEAARRPIELTGINELLDLYSTTAQALGGA
ncbi:STAS domain-containing protein [Nocardia sp. NPDC056000]|uniref:STAS domain-containing protein n=1 Tax=Nocardia sp. NPDC056000 TaxID=3345674 RepID=UPI0035D6B8DF